MIPALDATLTVTREKVTLTRTLLAASLAGAPERVLDVRGIDDVALVAPDEYLPGAVRLACAGETVAVRFAPHQGAEAEFFAEAVRAAMRGETPADDAAAIPVPGLDCVVADVRLRDGNSGPVESVALAEVTDGVVGEEREISDAAGLADALGSRVLVAHNAQLVLGELVRAGLLAGPVSFGCTLALARAARLDPPAADHTLAGLAEALGVQGEGAARVAGVLAGLARSFGHGGDVAGLFHDRGLTLGEVRADGTVYPVLHDLSGAAVAAQRRALTGAEADSGAAAETSADSAKSSGSKAKGSGAAKAGGPDSDAGAGAGSGAAEADSSNAVQEALISTAELSATARNESSGSAKSGGSGRSGSKSGGRGGKSGGSRGPAPWAAVATPDTIPEPNPDADPEGVLYGENVTLTGDFEPFDKGQLWAGLAHHGAKIGKNVTKKTTILVVGSWASTTSKEKRARELQEKGQEIQIWPAADLLAALGLDEEPPF
ncbi:BRCT domain-containing protein [Corynebacterium frankenforstense]